MYYNATASDYIFTTTDQLRAIIRDELALAGVEPKDWKTTIVTDAVTNFFEEDVCNSTDDEKNLLYAIISDVVDEVAEAFCTAECNV